MPLLGTFITLPNDIASSTLSTSGSLISDLSPAWLLIIGVLLAGLLITIVVGSLHKH